MIRIKLNIFSYFFSCFLDYPFRLWLRFLHKVNCFSIWIIKSSSLGQLFPYRALGCIVRCVINLVHPCTAVFCLFCRFACGIKHNSYLYARMLLNRKGNIDFFLELAFRMSLYTIKFRKGYEKRASLASKRHEAVVRHELNILTQVVQHKVEQNFWCKQKIRWHFCRREKGLSQFWAFAELDFTCCS